MAGRPGGTGGSRWVRMGRLRRSPSWKLARWECWKFMIRGEATSPYPLTFGATCLFQIWNIQVPRYTSAPCLRGASFCIAEELR